MSSSARGRLGKPLLSSPDDAGAIRSAWVGGLLLACGVIGAPVNIAVFTVEGALRPGYSAIRDYTSFLSLGPDGWINVANFIVFGVLMTAFAAGVTTVIRTGPAAPAGPILLGVSGIGLMAAGLFVADAASGAATTHGSLHIAASVLFLAAMTAACFVFGGHYKLVPNGARFAMYCRVTGVAFAVLFGATPVLDEAGIAGLLQRIGILVLSTWIVLLAVRLIQERAAAGLTSAMRADET
jgi:hypothetical protein